MPELTTLIPGDLWNKAREYLALEDWLSVYVTRKCLWCRLGAKSCLRCHNVRRAHELRRELMNRLDVDPMEEP